MSLKPRVGVRSLSTLLAVASVIVVSLVTAGGSPLVDPVSARAQGAAAEIVFTGLPLSEGVRYNVAFIPPEGLATTNLRAEIALPTDAVVVQANQTEGRTRFVGQDGSTLTWTAPGYDADRPVDGLSFVLTQPLSRP